MKLARSLLRLRRHRPSPFFTRRRRGSAAADNNPEPSSPKVTCIGQVRVKSQKRVKQYRRRISGGEASFRSAEPSFQHQQRRSQRDQRWVHLPSISVLLRAVGHEFCCFFRCCRCTCSCFERREREKAAVGRSGSGGCEDGRGELFGRWLVAVHGGGGSRNEIEVVVDEEAAAEEMGNSRRHVFDDIEVVGDRIEVKKGGSFVNGGFSVCIPPKNALLLMRCRSDPLKMAAIANRISSDALRYENGGSDEEDEVVEDDGRKIFVIQVYEKEKKAMGNHHDCVVEEDKSLITCSEEKIEEEEEEEEEVESNMSSFEALLEQENTENSSIKDETRVEEQVEDENEEETTKSDADKSSLNGDENPNPTKTLEENDEEEKNALALPENQVTAAAAEVLPECLLLMMREPKLSMEVSKETWVCATDFIRLLPERPRRAAAKAAAAPAEQVKRRAAVEKSKPRVPPLPSKKNDVQPARSSCSLPAAAVAKERKRVTGGACEPLALTRCKSEPMSTAAAKLMPEPGCWKENVGMKLEPHRQAAVGVGAGEVGV